MFPITSRISYLQRIFCCGASANINNLFNRKDYEVSLYQRANFQYYRVPLRGREFMISLRLKY